MAKTKSISEVLKAIKEKVQDTLINDVAEAVKNVEIYHVYNDVYSRPESAAYERRYSNGGIGDVRNIEKYIEGDTLVLDNNTEFNPYLNGRDSFNGNSMNAGRAEGLDGLIEYGDGWNGINYDWAENEPGRPFIRNTIDDLNQSKDHVRMMIAGLRKRGLDVKWTK